MKALTAVPEQFMYVVGSSSATFTSSCGTPSFRVLSLARFDERFTRSSTG